MKVINSIEDMQRISRSLKADNKKISFVPTMGYLHEGHTSLIKKAKEYGVVVASIFVNPMQFGPTEDYSNYPRDLERDIELANNAGVHFLFVPKASDMYPKGFNATIELSGVTDVFEGEKREGHFNGVATIVAKLFNIVDPDFAVFGQKDYQQTLVIKKLINDLNFNINLIISPTIRENNGLAKSSRNSYLTKEEIDKASVIYKSINETISAVENGEKNRKIINAILLKNLRSIDGIKIDYAESAIADNLERPEYYMPGEKVVLLVAAYLGKTRLIDNALVKIPYNYQ